MFGIGFGCTETRIRAENSQISSNIIIAPWFRTVFKQQGFYSASNDSSILMQDCGKANVNERSGHKLKHKKCCLNIRKAFFSVEVTKHWHRALREAVKWPPIFGDILKPSKCGERQPPPTGDCLSRVLDKLVSRGSLQPQPFYGFVVLRLHNLRFIIK